MFIGLAKRILARELRKRARNYRLRAAKLDAAAYPGLAAYYDNLADDCEAEALELYPRAGGRPIHRGTSPGVSAAFRNRAHG